MVLFSNKDTTLIAEETQGYTKIKTGINKVYLNFPPLEKPEKFYLDLGFNGDIEINKRQFGILSKQFPYKKILSVQTSTIDATIYMFENMDTKWGDLIIPGCQLIHSPLSNLRLVGAGFMQRFNFILAYGQREAETQERIISRDNLYIQQVSNFETLKSIPFVTSLGFRIGKLFEKFIISGIEIGSVAEQAGLQIRDEVISVNNGEFELDFENFSHKQFVDYIADKENVVVTVQRDGNRMDVPLSSK
jgi:hypothetical protein